MAARKLLNKHSPFAIIVAIVLVIWLVGIVNAFMAYSLNRYGLYPRSVDHLLGVFTMPLLHGSFQHLMGNTFAVVVLGSLAAIGRRRQLLSLTLFVAFWCGVLVWVFGRPSFHIGLSGVIFGYWGFALANGYFERSFKAISVSLFTLFFYGAMVWQVFPLSQGVSFEGHFFGALAGIAYSYIKRRR